MGQIDSLGREVVPHRIDGERAERTEDVGRIIERVVAATSAHIQDRTLTGMRVVLVEMFGGESLQGASARAGVARDTVKSWRHRYPAFDVEVGRLMAQNRRARDQALALERERKRAEKGLILTDAEIPDAGSYIDFRWKYFGRPTPDHQELAAEALEDESNLYTFIFGPTGMGKDTMAGDYVAYKSAPDRTGLRVAWFMETQPFSVRRMKRLDQYLTDPAAYRMAPEKTPGGQIPAGSLISDYGPFKWDPDMVWADGSEVKASTWNQSAKYYVRTVAPEQDPNLWATGVGGAAYGSRIGLCVCSDIFTKENQHSPTERKDQYEWLDGTLDTRLDEDGRLVVIGTWLHVEHNYELILENYVADARVLRQKTQGPATYTKYSNGVAVVVIKAIWVDPETGEERSYWPERFPLSDSLVHRQSGERLVLDEISDTEALELLDSGEWKRLRGLRSKRERSPLVFKAMFQQERDKDIAVMDFTAETLERARDPERSFGQVFSHEIKILGVDPARRYGAAWVLWAVDKSLRQLTLVDFFWGTRLGVNGVKDQLILKPLARWDPSWLCYEDNKDGSVLAETVVYEALKSAGVSVYAHTTGMERSSEVYGPGAMAAWMRDGRIKIPYRTAEDRARAMEVESHFKAWDSQPDRSKAGQAGHNPDDIAMAAWVGWIKGGPMVDRNQPKGNGLNMGVPIAIRQKYDRAQKAHRAARAAKSKVSERDVLVRGNPLDTIKSFIGED
jgi:hypothetical protein